jgi:hypothetical protein
VPVAVFCPIFNLQKIHIKRSPNEAKLFVDFFWARRQPSVVRVPERWPEVGNTHQAVPEGPCVARGVLPSSEASRTTSLLYKFLNIPKTLRVTVDEKFRHRKPPYPPETNRGPFSVICRRGESSPEAIIIIPEVSVMRKE